MRDTEFAKEEAAGTGQGNHNFIGVHEKIHHHSSFNI